jgi:hypothetical protein
MAEGYASRVARALLIIVSLVLWFLPLIIATLYKLPHQGRIAVLSIALGWTGVAWLAALTITVGGAIRATEPPAQGSREWPGTATRPQARAPDTAASREWPGSATRPQARAPETAASREWPGSVTRPQARAPDTAAFNEPSPPPEPRPRNPTPPEPTPPHLTPAEPMPPEPMPPGSTPPESTPPEPSPTQEQPSFPPVRSPWPGRQ